MSGHADKAGLTKWMLGFKNDPKMVFIVHGDDTVTTQFAKTLEEHAFIASAPYSGTEFDIISGQIMKEGIPVPVKKKESTLVSDVYARLKAAGARLMGIIAKAEGMTNKDKAKFADQINSLCDKWSK